MKRYFNTTGYCRPDWHYIINPLRNKKGEIDKLIENKQYFLIHAPRQTGKTTLLHALAEEINKEGRYICVVFSVENAGYKKIPVDKAMYSFINSLYQMAKQFLPEIERPQQPSLEKYPPNDFLFYNYLIEWSEQQNKPIVLLIDEIDSIWDDVLISTLRQLRNGFQIRPQSFPASIALVGLRDIRDYKMKIKEQNGALGSGSPFNIKAKSFLLDCFSKQEVADLYAQYTEETGQAFSSEVIDLIYELTGGQPWLVNAIANEIVEKILKRDFSAEITAEIVEKAKNNLIQRRDTHLDSLTDKLREGRVRRIIQGIISGDELGSSNTYNDDLQYTIDLGIVKDTDMGVQISNKIYSEIIPRVLNKNMHDKIKPKIESQWFIKNGKLQIKELLQEFQQFYRENAEIWLDDFSYQEAGKQLLLMAFLQRILNGGGRVEREMAYGRGRVDLIIDFGGERFILELKIKRSNYNHNRALKQLWTYLDRAGQKHGYLILFEEKSSKEIPWEERIKWEETEYERQGTKREITIVEM